VKQFIRLVCLAAGISGFALAARAADGQVDVTEKVAAAVKDNALTIEATNDNFTDPKEGEGKKLKVDYKIGDVAGCKVVDENAALNLAATDGKKLTITKAVYGIMDDAVTPQNLDVTKILADAVKDKKTLNISADNDTMKGDPAVGTGKELKVEYTVGGNAKTATVAEGETLALPASGDGDGELIIKKATYGVF
jgi:hypothetical protein